MDVLILAALSERKRFNALSGAVPVGMVSPETQVMLQWYALYWSTFQERDKLDPDELASLIRLRSGEATPESIAVTLHMVDQLRKPVSEDAVRGILSQLHELDLSGKAGAVLARYNNGEEVDLSFELQQLSAKARRSMTEGSKPNWADKHIKDYLNADSDDGGLQWESFKVLHQNLKGLRIGDNVAVCAPTDKGKTSLLCRLAVDFQKQAKLLYPGRPLLYLVNEGTADRIITRMYGTALGLNRAQMLELSDTEIERRYTDVVGRRDAIRIVNIHGKGMAHVSQIIEQHEPHLVITDMTGRIRASSNKAGGSNDISQLEEVWNDMRELAVIQQFAHVGTVQVSAEGFDQLYPPVSALQNSKTGIQTTLDLILMMGALVRPELATLRGISTPKNKLGKSDKPSLNQFEVYFNAQINKWEQGA